MGTSMKKVVIAVSAKLQKEVNKWIDFFESKNYEVLDYPKKLKKLDLWLKLGWIKLYEEET